MKVPIRIIMMMSKFTRRVGITGWTALLVGTIGMSRSAAAQGEFLYHPEPLESGEFVIAAGLSVTFLPQIIVEEEFRQSPLVNIRGRYGLPAQFSVEGGLRSNVITNFVDVRGRYAFDFDPIYAGASFRLGWWYGFAPFDGFDITAASWLYYPGLEFGTKSDDVRFGATVEMQVITSLSIQTDGIETDATTNELAGYSLYLFTEQPFWGETSATLGLRVNYSKSLYQSWLAFTSSDEYLFYPEFTMGFLF